MKIKSKNVKGNLNEIINSSGKPSVARDIAEALNIKENIMDILQISAI